MPNLIWKDLTISNQVGLNMYCDHFFADKMAPNIIYIQTPVGSIKDFKRSYEPLANSGCNIFAIDFTGIGKSEGSVLDFSLQSTIDDLNCCVAYIKENFHGKIHMYGGTGIGGIIGENFASQSTSLASFSQYGIGIHNVVPMKNAPPLFLLQMAYGMAKFWARIFPKFKMTMNAPKYKGYHAELDDSFYEITKQNNLDIFKVNIHIAVALFALFLDKNCFVKHLPQCPTLVFIVKHDRYFPLAYFEKYFTMLQCEKKQFLIDDVHNSHYFHADEICEQVKKWVLEH